MREVDMIDERGWFGVQFDARQREHMRESFQPLGFDHAPDELLVGPALKVAEQLGQLIGWFDNPRDRDEYAVPLLRKLVELARSFDVASLADIEGLHFVYQAIMEHGYKLRTQPEWLDTVVWAAQSQVAIAPRVAPAMRASYASFGATGLPGHRGYERLAILADKSGDDEEVLHICVLAQSQGWDGTWDKRIKKAQDRIERPR